MKSKLSNSKYKNCLFYFSCFIILILGDLPKRRQEKEREGIEKNAPTYSVLPPFWSRSRGFSPLMSMTKKGRKEEKYNSPKTGAKEEEKRRSWAGY